MKLYWVKTIGIIKQLFSNYYWDFPNNEKKIYLTFDDGPTPEITEWVLDQLKKFEVKATFFCIGNNIENNTEIFNKIIEEEHLIGNHTFNHLNGWKTSRNEYIENINQCSVISHQCSEEFLKCQLKTKNCQLFRPPYGKIKPSQANALKKLGYKIIMWDVLSADFDRSISPEQCLKNVKDNVTSGSIIVFHDSIKAFPNLKYVLPKALAFFKEKGYVCEVIK